jgi:hypothetical protein
MPRRRSDWTPEINQAYGLAGLPSAYEQAAFFQNEDSKKLRKNLLNYAEQMQRQVRQPRTV